MATSAFTYRVIWPIEDPDRLLPLLVAEALNDLDVMAAADEARLVGEPAWTRSGDRLVCEVPAEPAPLPEPPDVDEAKVIRACRGERMDLTSAEVLAAVERLQRQHPDMKAKDIAARLRMSSEALRRTRQLAVSHA